MVNIKSITSMALASAILFANLNSVYVDAFAGYDDVYDYNNYYNDNYSYNENNQNTYSDYIYGIDMDEDNAVQVIYEEDEDYTDLTYTIENDQVTITGFDETVNFAYYTMPSIISGYPVTAISDEAFKGCKSLISIVIPNTVKSVGEYAFNGCSNLTSIVFETGTDTVEDSEEEEQSEDGEDASSDGASYDSYNFNYYDNADNSYGEYDYNYNNNYDYVNDDSDDDDSNDYNYNYDYNNYDDDYSYDYSPTAEETEYDYQLEDFLYNNDDETINNVTEDSEEEVTTTEEEEEEDLAVNPVSNYTSELNDGVEISHTGITAIMEHAFSGCTKLENITIPDSLAYMGAYAIEDTQYYTNCYNSGTNIILGGVYYKYFPTYTYTYEYNSTTYKYEAVIADFDLEIPEGIRSISYSAFQDVEGLTNVTMPESLRTIYDYAFAGCTSLTDITFYDGIQYVGNNAFQNTVWLDECPNGFAITGDYLYKYVGKGGSLTIPSKVKIIGNEAMALDSNITRVVIQDGVTKIMGGAFYRCENLQTVVVSGTVLSIGNQAFYGCKNLARITFNEGLLSIGEKCFVSCDSLEYAIIPSTVTQLGDMCFGFDYSNIHVSYSIIDGFTLVGQPDSVVQGYADSKTINFKSTDDFVVPKSNKEYDIDLEDDNEEDSNPVNTLLIVKVVGGLVVLLLILCLILYNVDKRRHPKKYAKKKKRRTKINKSYEKYKKRIAKKQAKAQAKAKKK